jgi:glutamate 5-kinase
LRLSERNYKRIVIKIGSSLFYSDKKKLDFSLLDDIADQISQLISEKKEVILVSSGAIALGMSVLKLQSRPSELSYLQAIAAIGQNELMSKFCRLFNKKGIKCGQVLLTWEDFNDRGRYLNAKNTLVKLLELGCVPVINENDTISTAEIKFGDNDQLSALVASLSNADLLVMLSDVDGLLMKDKLTVVTLVDEITPQIKALASPTDKSTSVGGMITKIKAAKISVDSGIPCVIANGRRKDIILTVAKHPESAGTLFLPKEGFLAARQRWIAFGAKPKGKVIVDEGAKKALISNKSLLSVGVSGIEGKFECGDVVSIVDREGDEFARGKVCVSCGQLDKIKGRRSEKEVIHCDNIVIF